MLILFFLTSDFNITCDFDSELCGYRGESWEAVRQRNFSDVTLRDHTGDSGIERNFSIITLRDHTGNSGIREKFLRYHFERTCWEFRYKREISPISL